MDELRVGLCSGDVKPAFLTLLLCNPFYARCCLQVGNMAHMPSGLGDVLLAT